MRCEVCAHKSSRPTCDRCWTRGLSTLTQLPSFYYALEAFLVPAKGYGERVQGTRTPPIPARLNVLHLRAGGIYELLAGHEKEIRNRLRHSSVNHRGDEGSKIKKSVEYLKNQWDWIRDNYSSVLILELDRLYGQIHNAIGNRSEDITIGTCPAEDQAGDPCGAILRINQKALESMADIKCLRCGTVWESTKWRLLGQIIEQTASNPGAGIKTIQGITQNHSAMGA